MPDFIPIDGFTLKVRRVQAGLTQYQLAQKSGIHPARISEMERGQRPVSPALTRVLEDSLSLTPPGVST